MGFIQTPPFTSNKQLPFYEVVSGRYGCLYVIKEGEVRMRKVGRKR
jgi:hypothetical protein